MLRSVFYKPKSQCKIKIYSQRRYGEPKLKKPKELHGIKQAFGVDWYPKKCKCSCFIKGKDIWVKHRDFNSIDVYWLKKNLKCRRGFVFNDNFGCLVLRGEAWLIIENLITDIENKVFPPKICASLAEQITGDIGAFHWERFFERIIRECINAI